VSNTSPPPALACDWNYLLLTEQTVCYNLGNANVASQALAARSQHEIVYPVRWIAP